MTYEQYKAALKDQYYAHPTDIAAAIQALTGCFDQDKLTDALYDIQAICDNDHNRDYWRTLYVALATISEAVATNEIRKGE